MLRDNLGDFELLILRKNSGEVDLPKGRIDPGENPIDAAFRETREEVGITNLVFYWGKKGCFVAGTTLLMLGLTKDVPSITPNPTTNEIEHVSYAWIPIGYAYEALEGCYMQPAIPWLKNILGRDYLASNSFTHTF